MVFEGVFLLPPLCFSLWDGQSSQIACCALVLPGFQRFPLAKAHSSPAQPVTRQISVTISRAQNFRACSPPDVNDIFQYSAIYNKSKTGVPHRMCPRFMFSQENSSWYFISKLHPSTFQASEGCIQKLHPCLKKSIQSVLTKEHGGNISSFTPNAIGI